MVTGNICGAAEEIIGKEGASDRGKIIAAGVMIGIVQTIGVHEMRISATEFLRFFIHFFHKSGNTSGHMLCDRIGRFIGAADQDAVNALFHRKGLTGIHADGGSVCRNGMDRLIRKRNGFVQGGILHCQQTGQDLGGAGRIHSLMHVFIVQDGAAAGFHEHGALGVNVRCKRPVRIAEGSGRLYFGWRLCADALRGEKKAERKKQKDFAYGFQEGSVGLHFSIIPE